MELNDKIQAYLAINHVAYEVIDYMTGQPEGQEDQILKWDASKLGPIPTTEQLDAAIKQKEAEEMAVLYKAQRAAEYPPIADYLDGVVKSDQAQIQKYIDDCLAVKAKYPKPE